MSKVTEIEFKRCAVLTNLIHALAIVQEGYIKEIESIMSKANVYKYQYKMHVSTIRRNAELLRSIISTNDPRHAESFGEDSDNIEELIKELLNSKNIEI
jgi:hypothetical protein